MIKDAVVSYLTVLILTSMFHNAHAYFATKTRNSNDELLIIGSIIPDIAITKIISWKKGLHDKNTIDKFRDFIDLNYPEIAQLANGVMAHKILDDLSHIKYKNGPGYAFQNTDSLAKKVGEYYGLNNERAKGKAHNFIESGVDILLLQSNSKLQTTYRQALINCDQKIISQIFCEFFKLEIDSFQPELDRFIKQFTKYDFSKVESWTYFWADLEKFFDLKDIGFSKREILLKTALKIVKPTYQEFLGEALKNKKSMV